MRIGVYPGTFNPIHNGHLQTALETKENVSLDKLIFIPTSSPPHKDETEMICPQRRFEMVRESIKGIEGLEVSDVEISQEKTYTIDTIRHFSRLYPEDELFLIVGGDAFLDFGLWKRAKEFIHDVSIIVNHRPGTNLQGMKEFANALFKKGEELETDLETDICVTNIYQRKNKSVLLNAVRQLDISSTNIRYRLNAGLNISFLVPPAALRCLSDDSEAIGHYLKTTVLLPS